MNKDVRLTRASERALRRRKVADLPPEQQVELYLKVIDRGVDDLRPALEKLHEHGKRGATMRPQEAAPMLRDQLTEYQRLVGEHVAELSIALDLDEDEDDAALLRKKLDQAQSDLAETQGQLFKLQQEQRAWQRELDARQATISDLQTRNTTLEARLSEFEGRVATEPTSFGLALGSAVDAIQQGLSELQNPHVDYGLQEFDLQTQVNLQLDDGGKLLIRFPGLNEPIAPQNLSQLHMRLRPIPKAQQNET